MKEVAQLCPTLSDPMDCSLPSSSIHGIFQARVLEWGAIAFSVAQSCLTLCNPTDCSLPSSSIHGIFQARVLQWVAISFSWIFPTQGSNLHLLLLLHWQADSLSLHHLGIKITETNKIQKNMQFSFFFKNLFIFN